ncbi:hypothetical protein VTH82DRAFT_2482 [Thermothelomyces myriococcoides]
MPGMKHKSQGTPRHNHSAPSRCKFITELTETTYAQEALSGAVPSSAGGWVNEGR